VNKCQQSRSAHCAATDKPFGSIGTELLSLLPTKATPTKARL
jgi:hypothetical protein